MAMPMGTGMPMVPPMMPSLRPIPPVMEEFPDNNTLYIRNINERLKQTKIKTSLRAVFKQFGDIIDVYCWAKSHKRKGQAWVVFRDVESAKRAKMAMQGFPFFQRQLIIRFAKADSDIVAKDKGTYVTRTERAQKRKEAQEAAKAAATTASTSQQQQQQQQQMWPGGEGAAYGTNAYGVPSHGNVVPVRVEEYPNKILFVTNLPDDVTDAMLQTLFAQYSGFVEVRLVPGRGMAFVEYQNEIQASAAKDELQNFKVSPEHEMIITFSKR